MAASMAREKVRRAGGRDPPRHASCLSLNGDSMQGGPTFMNVWAQSNQGQAKHKHIYIYTYIYWTSLKWP